MSNNHNGQEISDAWRTQPMYTFGEAARLATVSPATVRNWLFGYVARDQKAQPLFTPPEDQGGMVSFLQLIEIVVAGKFRKAERVSFRVVRDAYKNAQKLYTLDHPFAHLELKAIGRHIVNMIHGDGAGGSHQALDAPAQWTLPGLVTDVMLQLDYEQELAARWYPVSKDIPVVVDPRISAGMPVVLGRGVTIGAIRKRFKAGQRIAFIAQDFEIDASTIEEVLRYAEAVAA